MDHVDDVPQIVRAECKRLYALSSMSNYNDYELIMRMSLRELYKNALVWHACNHNSLISSVIYRCKCGEWVELPVSTIEYTKRLVYYPEFIASDPDMITIGHSFKIEAEQEIVCKNAKCQRKNKLSFYKALDDGDTPKSPLNSERMTKSERAIKLLADLLAIKDMKTPTQLEEELEAKKAELLSLRAEYKKLNDILADIKTRFN